MAFVGQRVGAEHHNHRRRGVGHRQRGDRTCNCAVRIDNHDIIISRIGKRCARNGECGVRLIGNGCPVEAPLIAERGASAGAYTESGVAARALCALMRRLQCDARRSVAGDLETPIVQGVNVTSFYVRHEQHPFAVRIQTVERTQESGAGVGIQHAIRAVRARVGRPGISQRPGQRHRVVAIKREAIDVDVAVRRRIIEGHVEAFVAIAKGAATATAYPVQQDGAAGAVTEPAVKIAIVGAADLERDLDAGRVRDRAMDDPRVGQP